MKEKIQFSEDGSVLLSCPREFSADFYVIPQSVSEIASTGFFRCEALKKIHIPEHIKKIGEGAFQGCMNLKITSDNSDFYIDEQGALIDGAENILLFVPTHLESYTIPRNVKRIGKAALWNCWALQKIDIPDSVIEIGDFAFQFCERLEEVHLSGNLKEIGESAFCKCIFSKIDVPAGVTKIGRMAFAWNIFLKEIQLPDSVQIIENNAFGHCEKLSAEDRKRIKICEKTLEK